MPFTSVAMVIIAHVSWANNYHILVVQLGFIVLTSRFNMFYVMVFITQAILTWNSSHAVGTDVALLF